MPIQSFAWIYFCIPRYDGGNAILSEPSGRCQNAATWLVDGRRLGTGPHLYQREDRLDINRWGLGQFFKTRVLKTQVLKKKVITFS